MLGEPFNRAISCSFRAGNELRNFRNSDSFNLKTRPCYGLRRRNNSRFQLDVAKDELEYAAWFSRDEVREALQRTQADPMLRNIRMHGSDPEVRQLFRYVPPEGAIAHHLIKQWVERRI